MDFDVHYRAASFAELGGGVAFIARVRDQVRICVTVAEEDQPNGAFVILKPLTADIYGGAFGILSATNWIDDSVLQIGELRIAPEIVFSAPDGAREPADILLVESRPFISVKRDHESRYLDLGSGALLNSLPVGARLRLSRWKIVVGPEDRPTELFASEPA